MKKENIKLIRLKVSGEDIIGIANINKTEKTTSFKYPVNLYFGHDKEDEKMLNFQFWLPTELISDNVVTFDQNEYWPLIIKDDIIELYLNILESISADDENEDSNLSVDDKKGIQLLLENYDIISESTIVH